MKRISHLLMMSMIFIFTLTGLSWAKVYESPYELEKTYIHLSENVGRAVVTINVVNVLKTHTPGLRGRENHPMFNEFLRRYFGQLPEREFHTKGLGSGFIINKEGYILTNEHVVGQATDIEVTLPDGRSFKADLIGSDPRSDIALIKIEGENLPYLTLGDSDSVKPGQITFALGNPFGHIVNNPNPTITSGIVSALHRTINIRDDGRVYGDLIQTDAAINQGNSGGPLVNLKGEVIGINTLIYSPSGGNIGLGFAIPINRGKSILNDLIEGREIQHGYLGIWVQESTREVLNQFGLKSEANGALVFKVEEESPAEKAGFLPGDIILEIEGNPVFNSLDVTRMISGMIKGQSVEILVFREGKEKTLKAKLGQRKGSEKSKIRQSSNEWRGMIVEELKGDKKGEKEGVIIKNVKFGSPAYRSRLRKGDRIITMGQNEVKKLEDFQKLAKKFNEEDLLILTQRGYLILKKD